MIVKTMHENLTKRKKILTRILLTISDRKTN